MSRCRVGFCLSDKKRRRMNLDGFAEFCADHGVEVVEIDFTQPLEPQGPFDVIVHKLSDVIVEAQHEKQSKQLLVDFQTHNGHDIKGKYLEHSTAKQMNWKESYVSAHSRIVLLDPLAAMTQILDRFTSYRIMSKLHNSLRDWRICSPPYLEVQSASDMPSVQQKVMTQNLSFPLICKTRVAHGSLSHEMSLIFSEGCLSEIQPPCVLQNFVNHGAVLHKVFVVGERHFCVERPSLKNFPTGQCDRKTIFFNSQQVSKPESSSDLTAMDEQIPCLPPPSTEAVAALVQELRVQLGMSLFGVDVIINTQTYTLTVIDINVFPASLSQCWTNKLLLLALLTK
ncbi:inositol-tetrakisphosphate 1-kinase-like isoform X4 [Hippocampus zosterae]|uniref:inositol-tetrakisphosphate 1-kinase-like isoform X4 n=1 Tax=Hippocampus zosterae TaxID=109293 RepID=UPI00223D9E92|nr:inositol-tetrakisphosphate 1-kinase-like isoform X4 [Hippocampus zosterae]